MAQLDLRYRFTRKDYLIARAGVFIRSDELDRFFDYGRYWAYGLEYARQSIVGPLRVAASWGKVGGFSMYASIGFDF